MTAHSIMGILDAAARLTAGRIMFAGLDLLQVLESELANIRGRELAMTLRSPCGGAPVAARHRPCQPQRLVRLRGVALWTRVGELADLVNLPRELLERWPHQLSGGQKARVGIARALAANPCLPILDERASALGVSVQAVILTLLADLRQRLGMSFLFISHHLNVVRLMCDHVLVMYLGKIIEAGPTGQVFQQPQHPYTPALVSAIPTIDGQARRVRTRLDGEPISPIDPDPRMCRFYGRCPRQTERCHEQIPTLATVGAGYHVACHYPEHSLTGAIPSRSGRGCG